MSSMQSTEPSGKPIAPPGEHATATRLSSFAGLLRDAGIGVETGEAVRALDSVGRILDTHHGIVIL
jgi:uncharacterized protein with von Willebrand factor type A (vWA) domain